MKVNNKKCIRHISVQKFKSTLTRNIVAISAIALTTILFTSLFTIALSINKGFEEANFRQAGSYAHGTFKYLTEQQLNELKTDSLIDKYGIRRFIGMPESYPFDKSHVEVSYADKNYATWSFCTPEKGHLPKEGTNEAATDTKVLELLGITPEIGTEFTLDIDINGTVVKETFILSGWWTYDEAVVANHVLVSKSKADEILSKVNPQKDSMNNAVGKWSLDVMFKSSRNIEKNMDQILSKHDYQRQERNDRYIAIGINWGYSAVQFANSLDATTIIGVSLLLLLIIFTGYLIIYNIFQISVVNDIRFYGLLKTIGTTPKQIKAIINNQAMLLSSIGIPIGLLIGWIIGGALTPLIVSRLNKVAISISSSPILFIASAIFSLFTVFLSCRRPGNIASRVSAIEAVRYTENDNVKKKTKKSNKRLSIFSMARANLARNKGKTIITIVSLSLAIVLLNLTVSFATGFDMDKYLENFVSTDFVFAKSKYFQTGNTFREESAVKENDLAILAENIKISGGGRTYGQTSGMHEYVTEEYYRNLYSLFYSKEQLDSKVEMANKNSNGLIETNVQLYGMEDFILDQMIVLDGDISELYKEENNAIAAVYSLDDYSKPVVDSHWAKLGDKVTIRYVDEYEYFNPETGEIYTEDEISDLNLNYSYRAVKYRDVEYTVKAIIAIPTALGYRYYGSDEFVLNAERFKNDSKTANIMYYAFNTLDEDIQASEEFISMYTNEINTDYDYESKEIFVSEFESFRSMFLILGGFLSFIVALVGILNFFNVILTSILSRKREFAILESIGMTGRQLKIMVVYEGLLYAAGSVLIALIFTLGFGPLIGKVLSNIFWFYRYKLIIYPIIILLPIFSILGITVPLLVYKFQERTTVVERLRTIE